MAEIIHNELKSYIETITTDPQSDLISPVYLIYGEELLVKQAFQLLLDVLVPEAERSLHYEPIDADRENMADTIEKVNTFSILSGRKVIAVTDSKIFISKKDSRILVDKARSLFERKELDKATKVALELMGLLNIGYEDASAETVRKQLASDLDESDEIDWLMTLIAHGRDNGMAVPSRGGGPEQLEKAVTRGFPHEHHLILTVENVDRRRSLFKTIAKHGTVINCAVPKGDRMADRKAQQVVLSEQARTILSAGNKSIDRDAFKALQALTGFDLRTFSGNLEKLINFVGDRPKIELTDVEAVLKRSRKDPIYELTNSLTERHLEQTLFFFRSLLADEIHPLQILSAIVNQVRRLLLFKDFVESPLGVSWQPNLSYDRFRSQTLPAIKEFDATMLEQIENQFSGPAPGPKRKKIRTDLVLAKNPKSPYPVFLLLQKSEGFSRRELADTLIRLHRADLSLKTSAIHPRMLIEKIIFDFCRRPAPAVSHRER